MNLVLELARHLKRRDKTLLQRYRITRPWITRHSRFTALYGKNTKTPEFDTLTFGKCIDDTQEKTVNDRLRLELCEPGLVRDLIHDVGLRDVQDVLFRAVLLLH